MFIRVTLKDGTVRVYPFKFESRWAAEFFANDFRNRENVEKVEVIS